MPELVGMGAFYQGVVDSEARWETKRANARRAFMEYSQQFPNASYEDYQSFVDNIAGGENYVRGILPSDKVLKSLAEQNQQRFAQQQMENNLNMMSKRAQVSGQMDALLQNQLMITKDDDQAIMNAASQMGFDPKNPATHQILQTVRQNYGGEKVDLSPLRAKLRNDLFSKNMPILMENIEKYPGLDFGSLMKVSGINTDGLDVSIFKEMAKKAQEEVTKKLYDEDYKWVSTNLDQLYDVETGEMRSELLTSDNRKKIAEQLVAPRAKMAKEKYRQSKAIEIATMADAAAASIMGGENAVFLAQNKQAYQEAQAAALRRIQATHPNATMEDITRAFKPFETIGQAKLAAATEGEVQSYLAAITSMASLPEDQRSMSRLPVLPKNMTAEQQARVKDAMDKFSPDIKEAETRTERSKEAAKAKLIIDQLFDQENGMGKAIATGNASEEDIIRETNRIMKANGIDSSEIDPRLWAEMYASTLSGFRDKVALTASEMAKTKFDESIKLQDEASRKQINAFLTAIEEDDPEKAAILMGVANNILFNGKTPATASAAAEFISHVQNGLYENAGGDPMAIAEALATSPDYESLRSKLTSPQNSLEETGMVYGASSGSVEDYLSKKTEGTVSDISTIVTRTSSILAKVENAQVDGTQAIQNIDDTIAKLTRAIREEKDDILRAKKMSPNWSDNLSPMTDAQAKRALDLIDAKTKEAIAALEAQKKRIALIIEQQNMEDQNAPYYEKMMNRSANPKSSPQADPNMGQLERDLLGQMDEAPGWNLSERQDYSKGNAEDEAARALGLQP